MPIRFVTGDLFSTDAKYICHQVNCQGKMGSGVAKQVREKFPMVFENYKAACDSWATSKSSPYTMTRSSRYATCSLRTDTAITATATRVMTPSIPV